MNWLEWFELGSYPVTIAAGIPGVPCRSFWKEKTRLLQPTSAA